MLVEATSEIWWLRLAPTLKESCNFLRQIYLNIM